MNCIADSAIDTLAGVAGCDRRHGNAAAQAMFNNDLRLRALRTLTESLQPIEQKKAIIYFSAGMQRSGQDEVAAGSFQPGLYTCQINIIDEAAGRFTFPRVVFLVR